MQPHPPSLSFRLHGHGQPRSSILLTSAAALILLLTLCYAATPAAAFGFGRVPSATHHHRQPHRSPAAAPSLFDFGSSGLWADSDDLLLSLLRPHRPVQQPAQSLWHPPRQQQPSLRDLHQAQLQQLALQNERHEAHIAALQQQLAQQRSLLQQMMGERLTPVKSDLPAPSKQTQQQTPQHTQPRRVPVEVQPQKSAPTPSAAAAPAASPAPQQQSRYIIARNPDNSLVVKRVPVEAPQAQKQQPKPAAPVAPSCRAQQQQQQQQQQQARPRPAHECRRQVPVQQIQRQQPAAESVAAAKTKSEPQLTPNRIPPTQASVQSVPVAQMQQQPTTPTPAPIAATPVASTASTASTTEADDDTPVLTAVEHPTHWDVSLPLPGVSAAYVHAEIRGKHVVLFGERHYEDKAVLLPEEVGRIGRYGVVRRVWKMPQAPADPAQRIDVQSAEARYDQSAEVLHVRLYKSGFLPAGQSGNVRVAGPTIHVLIKAEGVPVRREQVVLPQQPSPLDVEEHEEAEEQYAESAAQPVAALPKAASNLTQAPVASDLVPAPAVASARPATVQGASA